MPSLSRNRNHFHHLHLLPTWLAVVLHAGASSNDVSAPAPEVLRRACAGSADAAAPDFSALSETLQTTSSSSRLLKLHHIYFATLWVLSPPTFRFVLFLFLLYYGRIFFQHVSQLLAAVMLYSIGLYFGSIHL